MKKCPTCLEEFADKFSFCPVDGAPLPNGFHPSDEDTVTVAAAAGGQTSSTNFESRAAAPEFTETVTAIGGARQKGDGADFGGNGASASAAPEDDEYHLTFLDDEGLVRRLTREVREVGHEAELSWPEFKRDPVGFVRRGASAYGRATTRAMAQPNVAKGIVGAFVGMLLLAVLVMAFDSIQSSKAISMRAVLLTGLGLTFAGAIFALVDRMRARHVTAVAGIVVALVMVLSGFIGYIIWENLGGLAGERAAIREDLEFQGLVTEDVPQQQPTPEPGTAGFNKGSGGGSKPKQEKPGGGGGGGRMEQKPASFGKLPPASLDIPQVRAPDPHPPTIKNPSLPVPATVVADPLLVPPDPRNLPYGDPKSKSTETSSGPGTGGGIGTGTGAGVGPGEGGGVGPGRGGNIGGGDRNDGGGGPGGGGGGGDYTRVFRVGEVSKKAQIISKPEPLYTEEARKNQITGTVVLRMVLNSNGTVTGIQPVSRLPDGLTEKAIAAAKLIRFSPAEKDGRKVSQYATIQYNFNIY
jgi:TonB family protein